MSYRSAKLLRGMNAITIDPNAWATFTSNDPIAPPGFNTPVTYPPGTLNCPGDPGCPGYVDPILAQQGVCTCVNGTCVENGNSCGSPAPASPVSLNWGWGQQGCPFYSKPFDNSGGFTIDASGKSTAGGKGCVSIFELYPVQFAVGIGGLLVLMMMKRGR